MKIQHKLFKKNLKARLTIILLLVALIPAITIEMVSYMQAEHALEQAALREMGLSNRISTQEIETFLPQFGSDLLSLVETPPVQAIMRLQGKDLSSRDEKSKYFNDSYNSWITYLNQIFVAQAENKEFYHQLRYLNAEGQEIAKVYYDGNIGNVAPEDQLKDESSKPYFLETSQLPAGTVYISDMWLKESPLAPMRIIQFAAPTYNPAGELGGVLVLDVYADNILNRLNNDIRHTYLLDQSGTYLTHPNPRQLFSNGQDHLQWALEQMGNEDTFVGANTREGEVIAIEKIHFDPNNPDRYWLLMRSLPEDIVLADINSLGTITLWLIIGTIVVAMAVAYVLARSITGPVSMLAKASERVARGDWSDPLPITSEDEIGQLACCFQDMAEQVQELIGTLKQNEARYRAISEMTSDYIYSMTVDCQGNLSLDNDTDQNPDVTLDWSTSAFTKLTGYTLPELKARGGWEHLLHPDDCETWKKARKRSIITGEVQMNEYRIITKDGSVHWLQDHWRPQWDDDHQQVSSILGAASDITVRKESEFERERLLMELRRLTSILENTSDFVCLMDLEGHFIYINPAGLRMVGRENDDYADLSIFDFLAEKPDQEIMSTLMEQGVWEGYMGLQHVDGHHISTTQVITLIRNRAGEPIAKGMIARDITELKRMKMEAYEAKEAAEAANQAKSEFLANMSHELRTPLNGILGYAQILKKESGLSSKQQNGLSIIQRSGEHLLTLINDILDLSKVEAGKMELLTEPFHLPEMLQNIADLFIMRAEQKGITFLYEKLTELPTGVNGDEKRLRQILINLLGNAVKFTETGGVTFKIGVIPPTETNTNDVRIRFQVEDTGMGIASQELDEIFEPFQQTKTSRMIEGTGLGLPISRKLVEMMGGTLSVRSILGEGSTFWFEICLSQMTDFKSLPQEDNRTIIGYRGLRRKVLIVDDKPENRLVLMSMLAPLEFELTEAVDGQDAVDKALTLKPDIILMDIRMPRMDGFTATREIRTAFTEKEQPVIITISASAFEHNKQESLAAGSDDFMAKPFKERKLFKLLRHYLKLEWIYDEPLQVATNGKATNGQVVPPPEEDVKALFDLAMRGNVRGIVSYANDLEANDLELKPFTSEIRYLAKQFKIKELRALIGQFQRT